MPDVSGHGTRDQEMAELDRCVLALIELLHEAPGAAAAWGPFLDGLRAEISPDAVVLFAAQPHEQRPGFLAGSGLSVSSVYLGDFLRPSVPHPSAPELPPGAVYEVPANSPAFRATVLYREVLEPAGVLPGPGLFVVTERDAQHVLSAALVLPTTPRWKPSAGDRALLERLAPHMVIARRLHLRLAERGRDSEALLAVFDQLVLGVVFLDERMRVSFANRSAAEILCVAAGFASPQSLAGDVPDERTLALERLLSSERGEFSARVHTHPLDGRPLQVLATPFRWRDAQGIEQARFTRVLFIGDPKHRTGDPIGVLHGLYGLTPGETRLTLLLLSGCSVEEAARLLRISVGTSRGVLKKVFEKTGTNRQAALVRLLLTGFGQVRPGARTEPRP
jgi:DNA-binding CsgD family transcriptional regulator